MFRYKKEIMEVFEKLEAQDDRCAHNDYFLMMVGIQELLIACGYNIEPEYGKGWVLKKYEKV